MPLSTTYTPTRPHSAPAIVATMSPLRKNSNSNGRRSSWHHTTARWCVVARCSRLVVTVREAVDDDRHAAVLEDLHARAVGALEDVGREHVDGPARADDAAVQADHARQVGGDAVEVVRRQQDRQAARVEVVEQVEDLVAQADVDAGRRLVHQQQLGLAEQRAGDEHALLLAAGELPDVAVAQVLDDPSRARISPTAARSAAARPGQPAAGRARHQHALLDGHREAPVDRLDLRHVGDPQALAPRHGAA